MIKGRLPFDPGSGKRGGWTADLPFTSSTASCTTRATCTDDTDYALMALAELGLSGGPFHEPFHADGR
jgi:hypothetical protein